MACRRINVAEWKPIKTAPKDGTWIAAIGHLRHGTPDTLKWKDGGWWNGYDNRDHEPTHWYPLPAADAVQAGVDIKASHLINELEYAVLARARDLPGSAEKLSEAKQAIRDALGVDVPGEGK
jgi:hypothetical protein